MCRHPSLVLSIVSASLNCDYFHLRHQLLDDEPEHAQTIVTSEVARLVETLWQDAVGEINDVISVTLSSIKLKQV